MEKPRKAMNSKEIARYARREGLEVEVGGKHKHILVPGTSISMTLPDHRSGTLSNDAMCRLIKFIAENSKKDVA